MGLQYTDKMEGQGTPGVFVQNAKIIQVNDLSGTVHPRIEKTFDLYLLLMLDVARSFTPTFELFGNFHRDQEGKVVEWGDAFKVGKLFSSCELQLALDENDRIPADMLEALKGRSFSWLKYIKGAKRSDPTKPMWVSWDITGKADKGEELKRSFMARVKAGKVKGFTPNFAAEAATSFNPAEFADADPGTI